MGFSSEFQTYTLFPQCECSLSASAVIHTRYFTFSCLNFIYMCPCICRHGHRYRQNLYIEATLSSVLPRYFRENSSTDSNQQQFLLACHLPASPLCLPNYLWAFKQLRMEKKENESFSVLNLFLSVNLRSCIHMQDLSLPKQFVEMACRELIETIEYHILQISVQAEIHLAWETKRKKNNLVLLLKIHLQSVIVLSKMSRINMTEVYLKMNNTNQYNGSK